MRALTTSNIAATTTTAAATTTTATAAANATAATLRAARIAKQQQLIAKAQHHVMLLQKRNSAKMQAYHLELAQVQAKYGIAAKQQTSSAQVQRAPSGSGVCAQVHTIAAQCNGVRKATLQACAAAGINAATAATQYARYMQLSKANKTA